MKLRFISLSIANVLCACTVGKDYHKPTLDLNEEWKTLQENRELILRLTPPETEGKKPQKSASWWKGFSDDTLVQLVDKAFEGNNDLKIVQARIIEARANERLSVSAYFPQIDATTNTTREKSRGAGGDIIDTTSQSGINGSWDIDLFGGNRRLREAAGAEFQAVEADASQTRLALIAEVARNYVRLRAAQQQFAITQRNLNLQKDTLAVTKGQRKEGAVSDLDVARAEAQAVATKARLPQIKASISSLLNRLSILTGEQPGTLNQMLSNVKAVPKTSPKFVMDAPVNAIANRPDVKAAERRLAKATSLSAAAVADFYPKLSLQGFFGIYHSELYGSVSPWSTTASALLPLLNFGKLTSQSNAADARTEQALSTYKQTVLLAMEEVESSLSNYINELNRHDSLVLVAKHQAKAAKIAREQYKSGVLVQIDLLLAERSLLDAENDVVLSEQAVAEDLILLYRALGDSGEEQKPAEQKDAEPSDKKN